MKPKPLKQVLILILLVCLFSCAHNQQSFNEALWRQTVLEEKEDSLYAPHFLDGKYFNPWMPREQGGFLRLLKMSLSEGTEYTEEESTFRPGFIPGLKERIESMPAGDFIAWIGHSTFLIRVSGVYILTDPIFSERALIPKRITPPAMKAREVNEVAPGVNVLISHNHYDHLDVKSLEALSGASRMIVPMGLKTFVEKIAVAPVEEMDWWQSASIDPDIKIICLPAHHWSRRLSQKTNETLWASYLIIAPHVTIYFAGDSGYFVGYREYGRLFPDITYAIIPTTALHPRAFMHYAHMNVEEALDAFQDLNAKYFIPPTGARSRSAASRPVIPLWS